jgi:cytochrome c biogenesis protein CcmG/thiol:disulfide interchange protein DsbE
MNSDRRAARPNRARTALLLILAVSFLFGLIVLPRLDPGASALLGQPAEDFALPVTHGGDPTSRIRLSDLRGQVVVLDFWASWCKPCLEQIPILAQAATALGERAILVGINTGDDPAGTRRGYRGCLRADEGKISQKIEKK